MQYRARDCHSASLKVWYLATHQRRNTSIKRGAFPSARKPARQWGERHRHQQRMEMTSQDCNERDDSLVCYERADLFDHFPVVCAVDSRLSEVHTGRTSRSLTPQRILSEWNHGALVHWMWPPYCHFGICLPPKNNNQPPSAFAWHSQHKKSIPSISTIYPLGYPGVMVEFGLTFFFSILTKSAPKLHQYPRAP